MVNLSNDNKPEEQSIIAKILGILWQRIIIVVIAVAIALIAFFCYVKLKRPDYTAYEKINYVVKNIAVEGGESRTSTAHINSEKKYISTVANFFATEKVVERANFYYDQFIKKMDAKGLPTTSEVRRTELWKYIYTINGVKVTDFLLDKFRLTTDSNLNKGIFDIYLKDVTEGPYLKVSYLSKEDNQYQFNNGEGEPLILAGEDIDYIIFSPIDDEFDSTKKNNYSYINKSNIGVTYDGEADSTWFTVSYKDYIQSDAGEKLKIVALAANQEIKEKSDNDYVYFKTLKIDLTDFGEAKATIMNVSRKKMLILFSGLGVIAGIVCVYLSTLVEKSVSSKKELEEITGVPFLTHIESLRENELR